MRLSRLRAVSAAVIPLVFLAACGSSTADTPANALDAITVGGTNAAPKVAFKTKPLSVKVTTTKIVTEGKGAKLSKDNSILFNYVLFNGKDGKQIESSFGKTTAGLDLSSTSLLPGLSKGLTGQQIGTRLLVAIPPVDAFGAQGNAQA
ncbi:MAG: FKBP-type peptidyl-prolyl cis-trans isomerase, partial [Actinomycetota bacterium]